jgi:hypothetical protein
LNEAAKAAAVGVTTDELDRIVHEAAIERECYPSPLNYYELVFENFYLFSFSTFIYFYNNFIIFFIKNNNYFFKKIPKISMYVSINIKSNTTL